jgi:salicylate hydroxylase
MLPYLAQGANSSLEDGAVLGTILKSVTKKSQLPNALIMYEKLRKVRSEAIARETFKQVCSAPISHIIAITST